MPSAIASTSVIVRGLLGDRRQDRRLVELLQAAGAPALRRRPAADHDQRRARERRLRHRADAVGHAGTGGEHGEPGCPGQLAGRLGGEHRASARAARRPAASRGSPLTAASYIGKTCAPDSVNIVSTPCAARDGDGEVAAVALAGGGAGRSSNRSWSQPTDEYAGSTPAVLPVTRPCAARSTSRA